jgi:hypothetical protein
MRQRYLNARHRRATAAYCRDKTRPTMPIHRVYTPFHTLYIVQSTITTVVTRVCRPSQTLLHQPTLASTFLAHQHWQSIIYIQYIFQDYTNKKKNVFRKKITHNCTTHELTLHIRQYVNDLYLQQ